MLVPPFGLTGKSVMKSILMSYQGAVGTGKGYSSPGGLP